ncbi:MAG: hypothetical protein ACOYMU_10265, partial [Phycisphaerales bacterium]
MKTTTLAICASLFISSIAVSQASTPPAEQPQGRPTGAGPGGPGGQGGPEGQGGPGGGQGATQLVQRLMQSDKDGDGKLSAE